MNRAYSVHLWLRSPMVMILVVAYFAILLSCSKSNMKKASIAPGPNGSGNNTPTIRCETWETRVCETADHRQGTKTLNCIEGVLEEEESVLCEPNSPIGSKPEISEEPQPPLGALLIGTKVSFSVRARESNVPNTYQWYHNDLKISDAIGPMLMIEKITSNDIGIYFVKVTNQFGEVNSVKVALAGKYAKSCSEIRDAQMRYGAAKSGDYEIGLESPLIQKEVVNVSCDMETDGGGWMLVLNYVHRRQDSLSTKPELLLHSEDLPLLKANLLGDDESSSPANWGHANRQLMKVLSTNGSYNNNEIRFFCKSSKTNGKHIHFKLKDEDKKCINYFTGDNASDCELDEDILDEDNKENFSSLDGHFAGDGYELENTDFSLNKGDYAMTSYTFHWDVSGSFDIYWDIGGASGSQKNWKCGDAAAPGFDTIHRIWVR